MARTSDTNYSFSHSEFDVYKTCKRRWMLQYWMKLRRKSSPRAVARDTGILVHDTLHQYYVLGGGDDARAQAMQFLGLAQDADLLKVSETERDKVEEIHSVSKIVVNGYFAWLEETGADNDYIIDKSEVELRAPGPVDGTEVMGIIDLGGTHKQSGDLMVMDTKVVANIDDMIKSLGIGEQGPQYGMLAKMLDPNPDRGFRVVWNMLKRNKQSLRAKPPFYQRYELAINADQLRQFYMQVEGQILDVLRTERLLNEGEHHAKVAYPSPSKDCSWKCPYFNICPQFSDPRTDVQWTINQYFTTPEQRKSASLVNEQRAEHPLPNNPNTEEGA